MDFCMKVAKEESVIILPGLTHTHIYIYKYVLLGIMVIHNAKIYELIN